MKNNNETQGGTPEMSRRNFLKKSSLAPLAGFLVPLQNRPERVSRAPAIVTGRAADTVKFGLVGFGPWGREIAASIARMPEAELVAVADDYPIMLRRVEREGYEAATFEDYRGLLDMPDVQVVVVATPTHLHREVAVAALEAGKHVYCEAPLATTIEDARAIAQAAKEVQDAQVFQAGLQYRSNPQHRNIYQFIRSGAVGSMVMMRAQWHSKESWRVASPSREREMAANWRLNEETSIGLVGEMGIHQIDTASWILEERPSSVTGYGQIMLWDDGRTIPDTIQSVVHYPSRVRMVYDATLASSFDAEYDMFYGVNSTIMLRDSKGWMFKEVDAPMLGWEVYARKDTFYREQGIALAADATQLDAQNVDPAEDDPNVETPVFYALQGMVDNVNFGPYLPPANYQVGYEATVVAIKAHEAIMEDTRIEIDDELLAI